MRRGAGGLGINWRVVAGAVSATMVAVSACSRDGAPTAAQSSDRELRGYARVYAMTAEGFAEVAQARVSVAHDPGLDARERPVVSVDSLPTASRRLAESSAGSFGMRPTLERLRREHGPSAVIQPRIRGKRFEFTAPDGRRGHVIMAGTRNPRTRDAYAATTIFLEDRLVAIHELSFRQTAGATQVDATRLTVFDSSGKEVVMAETGALTPVQTAGIPRPAPSDAVSRFVERFSPKPLYAADLSAQSCLPEWLNFLGALAIEVGTASGTYIFFQACWLSGGIACWGAGSFMSMLVGASLQLASAFISLERCLNEVLQSVFPPEQSGSGTPGPGGGGGGSDGCVLIHWYICTEDLSYCEFWYTEIRCSSWAEQ